jgi:hypothetical protein
MKALVPSVLIVGALIGWLGPDFSAPAEPEPVAPSAVCGESEVHPVVNAGTLYS